MDKRENSRIEKLDAMVRYVPKWLMSVLVFLAVCWLTLAPHPVGEMEVELFPGVDKVVHAAMFMALTLVLLLDTCRARRRGALPLPLLSLIVFSTALFGVFTEWLQSLMEMGRQMEVPDMVADVVGAIFGGASWVIMETMLKFRRDTERSLDQNKTSKKKHE